MAVSPGTPTTDSGTGFSGGDTVALPTHSSGDLLIVAIGVDNVDYSGDPPSPSGSWTELSSTDRGSRIGEVVYGLVATSSSETLTVTMGATEDGPWQSTAFVLTGHDVTSGTIGNLAHGSDGDQDTGNTNPGTFTGVGTVTEGDYMVLAFMFTDADTTPWTTPSGYTDIQTATTDGTSTIGACYKNVTANTGTEVPGNWGYTTTEQWVTFVTYVPAAAATDADAGQAAGTGTCYDATVTVAASVETSTATGTGYDATVTTAAGSVIADAATASATGVAHDATAAVPGGEYVPGQDVIVRRVVRARNVRLRPWSQSWQI